MGLVSELRRRNVFRVALAYILVAWLILQVGDTLAPALRLPDWVNTALAFFLILGFPLAIVFAWAYELTPEGIKLEKDIDRSQSITQLTGRKLDFMIIGVLSVALVMLAFDRFDLGSTRDPKLEQIAEREKASQSVQDEGAKTAPESIAVLPFVNLSGDAEQEYFADGLADEILTVLARVPDLKVAPRSATFSYKGDNPDIARVVRELDVGYVLTGSVRRAEDRVRIFAELVGANDKSQLWSNTFEGQLGDVFAIQDEIALAIARHLKARLADARGNTVTVSGTSNVEAHNTYLKGRFLLHKRGDENVRLAIAHFAKATELDPEYAEAYAALAYAESIGWGQVDKEGAKHNAARAIQLDPSLPSAWIASAKAKETDLDFTGAEQDLREALALEPRNAIAWHTLALLIYSVRGPGEALSPALKAVTLDPSSAIHRAWLGNYYMALGEVGEGMTHLDSAMEIDVAVFEFPMLWKAVTGDIQGAEAVLERAKKKLNFSEDREAWHRAFILVADGRVNDARILLTGRESPEQYYSVDLIVVSEIREFDVAKRIVEATIASQGPMAILRDVSPYMPSNLLMKTYSDEFLSKAGPPSDHGR